VPLAEKGVRGKGRQQKEVVRFGLKSLPARADALKRVSLVNWQKRASARSKSLKYVALVVV
jgi:hypothetical protein